MYSATSLGLIQGEAQPGHATILAPGQAVTRAEWATMLARAGGYVVTAATPAPAGGGYGSQGVAAARQAQPFADVPADAWFAPDVDALVAAGVIRPSAYVGGHLGPNQPITRAEAAEWAGRVLQ